MPDAPAKTQQRWSREELTSAELGRAAVCCYDFHRALLSEALPGLPLCTALSELPAELDALIVVGGGMLIDEAKIWRREHAPKTRLIAVPTLWGSGAEASPVAVWNTPEGKQIFMGPEYLPEARVAWPELAAGAPPELARWACGDVWSHAFEAFVSPLATAELRRRCSELMTAMLRLPLSFAPEWLDLSAEACSAQAASGVGLVHGFAHQLEAPLRAAEPEANWGHARLCSIFLLPVARFNMQHSPKTGNYAAEYGLDLPSALRVFAELFDASAYRRALACAETRWPSVARDRCSRVNHVLVRADALRFFQEFIPQSQEAE